MNWELTVEATDWYSASKWHLGGEHLVEEVR
jgi:hypothetical protein